MKTTIELPDELLIEAKKRAAELRQPLRRLIEDGLRAQLAGTAKTPRAKNGRRIRWVTVPGGLPTGVDVADRGLMHEWIRRHFSADCARAQTCTSGRRVGDSGTASCSWHSISK